MNFKIISIVLFLLMSTSIGFNIYQYMQVQSAHENEAKIRLLNNNMLLEHEYEVKMQAINDSTTR
jgi:hypothetical protein